MLYSIVTTIFLFLISQKYCFINTFERNKIWVSLYWSTKAMDFDHK